jgi:hypothetical protein
MAPAIAPETFLLDMGDIVSHRLASEVNKVNSSIM